MPKISVQVGSTSVRLPIFIQASTSTAGLGLTGLTGTSAGLQAWYYRGTGTAVPITLTTSTVDAPYTSGLLVEINATATGLQGGYRFDPPDACFGTGANVRSCLIGIGGAANMAPLPMEVELTGWNNQDGVAGGMIALSSTGTLGTVQNIRGTATTILLAGTHAGVVIPVVQTASNVINVLGTGTMVLWAGTHTGAVIPVVQTASNVLNLLGTATSVLWAGTHSGAVIPIVQTASNLVNGITGTATVILAPVVHTGATIPLVSAVSTALVLSTSNDGRMAFLDAAVSSRGTGNGDATIANQSVINGNVIAAGTNVTGARGEILTRATAGDAMTLTTGERTAVAVAYGGRAITEGYRANGVAPTADQYMSEMLAHLGESLVTGTSKVTFKLDHTTTAARYNLTTDSSGNPTAISRGA